MPVFVRKSVLSSSDRSVFIREIPRIFCFHSKEKAPEYNQQTSLDKVSNL